jgi:hypothetical protein
MLKEIQGRDVMRENDYVYEFRYREAHGHAVLEYGIPEQSVLDQSSALLVVR